MDTPIVSLSDLCPSVPVPVGGQFSFDSVSLAITLLSNLLCDFADLRKYL